MAKIEGLKEVIAAFEKLKSRYGNDPNPSVTVGFTQNYGLYVHEDLEASHNTGQAKFLQNPARDKQTELANIVKQTAKKGGTLEQGLLLAGLRLQREAQKLCPVDTGALKASAFTCLTKDIPDAAGAAAEKSNQILSSANAKKSKSK